MFGFRKNKKEIHRQMRRLISIHLDGELDEEGSNKLFAHLSVCKGCSEEMEEGKAALNYIKKALRPEEVGDIWPAIEDKVLESEKKRSLPVLTPIYRPVISYGIAALFGVLVGVFSGALSVGLFDTDSYTTTTLAGLSSDSGPSSFEYLEKTPQNSLSALYFGSDSEEMDD